MSSRIANERVPPIKAVPLRSCLVSNDSMNAKTFGRRLLRFARPRRRFDTRSKNAIMGLLPKKGAEVDLAARAKPTGDGKLNPKFASHFFART